MQLSEILEENSVKSISKKTNISEQNLEYLLANNFAALKKVKTLGFISIIEREYKADLKAMREEALEYYADTTEDNRITIGMAVVEEKKGTSKLSILIILGILGYASWYFFTQFDKKHLSELIPFIDEQTIEKLVGQEDEVKEIFIQETPSENLPQKAEAVTTKNEAVDTPQTEEVADSSTQDVVTETVESESEVGEAEVAVEKKDILILPFSRLWFGLVDMGTKDRDHFSIDAPYRLDITDKSWLVATSSAPFSLVDGEETKDFNDAKEHYFKIDKNGIESLTKSEYVTLGGWSQW